MYGEYVPRKADVGKTIIDNNYINNAICNR